MSTDKRLILWLVLSLLTMYGMQFLMGQLGLLPKPRPRAVQQAQAEPKKREPEPRLPIERGEPSAAVPELEPDQQGPEIVPKPELVLGALTEPSPDGYRLEIQLDQRGGAVESVRSALYEAERIENLPHDRPLELVRRDRDDPPSFVLKLFRPRAAGAEDDPEIPEPITLRLENVLWEVVRDPQGKVVQSLSRPHPTVANRVVQGQAVTFRAVVGGQAPITVTRTYTLWQGEDGFEMTLGFSSPTDQRITYELVGPHGIPIEGEWYTTIFRDIFFGGASGTGAKVLTLSASDVVKNKEKPERYTSLPLRFAGVENQYFAVFAAPEPPPSSMEQSQIAEARAQVVREKPDEPHLADVTVALLSKPIELGPNLNPTHRYRVFAGPKTDAALAPYGATELASYHKGWSIWGASFLAQHVITPMLVSIYDATKWIAARFGGTRGSYGIAIILLTMTVRLILFPLGRKQARAAQKMQDLQPLLAELKEKHGDDKEAFARAQFALFKEHGVNPMGGCVLALIQLPVLIGLWQALNNSVALRHSQFLWIDNLAAPDMLFKFPFPIPFLGPYFNLLPLAVVGLMLVQTKLFSPPATTPEAEMQQKMMKIMMIVMMVMFYKVPSGLGIYFITSSLWQIGERLLLPKSPPAPAPAATGGESARGGAGGKGGSGGGRGGNGGWLGRLQDRAQQLLEEAEKQRTVRKTEEPRERDRNRDRLRPRPRPR